jgi:hypothetical protein
LLSSEVLVEFLVAAFTGIGSLFVGIVALRLQHNSDSRTLVWPQLVRTHENGGDNLYVMALRVVEGVAVDVRYGLVTVDGRAGTDHIPLLESGEKWDVWPTEARTALQDGTEMPRLSYGVVWARTRSNKRRWQVWSVEVTDAGDVRIEDAFWSWHEPPTAKVFRKVNMSLPNGKLDLIATPSPS